LNANDVRTLVEHMASFDGRAVDDIAIHTWATAMERAGGWDLGTAMEAATWFYSIPTAPVSWLDGPNAGSPRPVLPSDITAFHAVREVTS
jgi:hypothetical protein